MDRWLVLRCTSCGHSHALKDDPDGGNLPAELSRFLATHDSCGSSVDLVVIPAQRHDVTTR